MMNGEWFVWRYDAHKSNRLFSHYPNENGVVREQQLTSRPTTEKDINDH
jgi:hypothetical protein